MAAKPKFSTRKKITAATLAGLLSLTFAGRALTSADEQHPCSGKERWEVKTLQDKAAAEVDYNHVINTTIADLGSIKIDFDPNKEADFYRHDEEKKVYCLKNVKITLVKNESDADGDYHLVLTQGNLTMIGEIPDYHCSNNRQSPAIEVFKTVRSEFQPLLVGKRYLDYTYDITGVGFFDPPHGQTGRNKENGIELHPILNIKIHQ